MVTFGLGQMQIYWVCIICNLNDSWSIVKVTRVRGLHTHPKASLAVISKFSLTKTLSDNPLYLRRLIKKAK